MFYQGAVHWAAGSSNVAILKMILEAGASPFVIDNQGRYPLSSVLVSDVSTWYDLLEVLINEGVPINARSDRGQYFMAELIVNPRTPPNVVRLLLEQGADMSVTVRDNITLLEMAKMCASPAVLDVVNQFYNQPNIH